MAGHRHFASGEGSRLIIASHNPGKVLEIKALLSPLGVEAISTADLDLPEPVEDGETFVANAEIKARAAATAANLLALADDSGLAVDALDGQPGIHSARWAGQGKDFAAAMARVENQLAGQTNRRAHYVCALSLCWPDGNIKTFQGRIDGTLVWPPRGDRGFGYDPMFVPDGYAITFSEFEANAKHAISHRAEAFRKMVAGCFTK